MLRPSTPCWSHERRGLSSPPCPATAVALMSCGRHVPASLCSAEFVASPNARQDDRLSLTKNGGTAHSIRVSIFRRPKDPGIEAPGRGLQRLIMGCVGESISSGQRSRQEVETVMRKENPPFTEEPIAAQFVHWFREGSPYIQGHRTSTFVVVLPGEVTVDSEKMNGILQDILLLHGLGIKLVIIPGTHVQIDQLLLERGHRPKYSGAYRVTTPEALAASMEAAGRVRLAIEAKLSRGPPIPILRRHGDNDRWREVSIASGNFLAAKRRGVVNGVDFGATGEVKRIDIARIRQRLHSDCIVMLSNLGYSANGEVLNCNIYEVATACAIALQADKMLCLLGGPILDDYNRLIRFMTLEDADKLIRGRAGQNPAAADYAKSVQSPSYRQSPGLFSRSSSGILANGSSNGFQDKPASDGTSPNGRILQNTAVGGFAIGGKERLSGSDSYLSELTAAVFVCRNGVSRVHLLDSNVQGVLLLELYTRDGFGTMVSSDRYEGTRTANNSDILSIMELLEPLEQSGILVNRPREKLEADLQHYTVVERDGSLIACAALLPYHDEECGEVSAFAVSPECRCNGRGDSLLDYIENKAVEMNLKRLFLLTTRTADWFIHRGFSEYTVDQIPETRQRKIDYKRGAKYYGKTLDQRLVYHAPK